MRSLVFMFCAAVLVTVANAQCEGGRCWNHPVELIVETEGVIFDREQNEEVAAGQSRGPSDRVAVKIQNGNACGSGSVVGRNESGSTILTNAHVVGTRVGRKVVIYYVDANGRDRRAIGTVKLAAYSDRFLTDWAIVQTDEFRDIEPVRLSTEKPSGWHYTRGSPRCVWPLRSTAVKTADVADNNPLWRWRPNSIGGQSGSGVWSVDDNLQYGLLSWSWGGLGAGQQTFWIRKQAAERSVVGPLRVGGETEVAENPVICETGFFCESGINDLDIWADVAPVKPIPDEKPNCEPNERRRLFDGLRDRAERDGVDFVRLIRLILEIMALFGGSAVASPA